MEETDVVTFKTNPLKNDVYVDLEYMELQFRRHKEWVCDDYRGRSVGDDNLCLL
jgi:hypothetical protein